MSGYGTGTYGGGTYGDAEAVLVSTDPRLANYQVLVTWSTGTDADTSAYDDATDAVLGAPGIVIETGRDQARAFSPPVVPHCEFTLNNEDRVYSPGAELGPYVGRGPEVQVLSTIGGDLSDATVDSLTANINDLATLVDGLAAIPLFTGHIDTVEHGLDWGNHVVGISSLGQLTLLRNAAKVTTALYENIRTDEALTVILDAAGWPVDARELSVGQTTMRYWWLRNADAFEAAQQLLKSEGAGAALYEDGEGTLHFEDRSYRTTTTRSTTSTKVLWDGAQGAGVNVDDLDADVDSATVFIDSGNPNALWYTAGATISANPDEVVTEATATVTARSEEAVAQIWQAGTAFTLAPDETRDFYLSSSDPFKSAVTPVSGVTDYTVTAGSLSSITLDQTSGQSARLRLVASGSGASIEGPTGDEDQGIQVRAAPITERYTTTVRSTVDTGPATDRYTGGQVKTYDLGLWPSVSIDDAQSLVNDWVTQRQVPRDQFTLTIVNADAAHLLAIHSFAVSDRITIVNTQAVETLDAHVETLRHEITAGNLHRLTLGTEVVSSVAGVIDPDTGGGGGLPAQFGDAAPYAQFGTTHSFTS
jgi:hypothetical protein